MKKLFFENSLGKETIEVLGFKTIAVVGMSPRPEWIKKLGTK